MSFNNAIRAKNRASLYSSLMPDPVGETRGFMNEIDRANILGDAQKDYYKTVGDAQTNFYEQSGNQLAALQDSANFGDVFGGFGDLLSGTVSGAAKVGLIKIPT